MSFINDNRKAYPFSDLHGNYIPHEVARPAALSIYKLNFGEFASIVASAPEVEVLAIWSNADVLVFYADSEPVWDFDQELTDCIFCPSYSTTTIEANKNSGLWIVPISDELPEGTYTVTLQKLQAWKSLGQDAQLNIVG